MSSSTLTVHLNQLDKGSVNLYGTLSPEELDLPVGDEVVHPKEPLEYDLCVELVGGSVLVQGDLRMAFDCDCVRCLKPIRHVVELNDWACQIPIEGRDEEEGPIGDSVDLTPFIREDMVLAFPQHPLCESKCNGLPEPVKHVGGESSTEAAAKKPTGSVWAELDKLKLK